MTRQIQIGDTVVDQFPVFSDDGYTKVSGQTSFVSSVWKDAVVEAVPVTISEIGSSGNYKVEFEPDDEGLWRVEVLIDYNKDIWYMDCLVISGTTQDIYEMVRRALGLIHENIFIDETVFDADGQLVSCRTRLFDSKTNCDAATDGGSETTGLIAMYTLTSVWEGINRFKILKQTLES
jgi:hypothetical protein